MRSRVRTTISRENDRFADDAYRGQIAPPALEHQSSRLAYVFGGRRWKYLSTGSSPSEFFRTFGVPHFGLAVLRGRRRKMGDNGPALGTGRRYDGAHREASLPARPTRNHRHLP